ncbi:MAG: long-chain fatty acid--CoA ligase, partial [Acidobacteriaceae bacterium]|nr:long-chain fatty acid--CoA ligase [Acidobacteriaceae bacterium]
MLNVQTINDVFVRATERGPGVVMMTQATAGRWQPITGVELYGRVRVLAETFCKWGVGKGDRVAILAENRWEWAVVDFAVLAIGAVDVPLYPTLTPEQVGYILRDSGAKVAVVSSRKMYDKIVAAGDVPMLECVVVMDDGEYPGAISLGQLLSLASERQQPDAAFDAMLRTAQPGDLATIIYTSGTTGEPKGVMLTHGNIAANINYGPARLDLNPNDVSISFLPLSHALARLLDYILMYLGVKIAYCGKLDRLPEVMRAVKPTLFVAVPRVYEKTRQAVEAKAGSGMSAKLLAWALAVGRAHREETLAGRRPSGFQWKLADRLVFRRIREGMGGRIRLCVSGGAPLGMDTIGWFADIGIRIYEGYGLTETSPLISLNYPYAQKAGSVGKALLNVQCRIAADGEVEVKAPSVFPGYWNQEAATRNAFTKDGWFKTGDIGTLDADGYLSITDRKKEILKTSGGKMIAPQPIENKLMSNAL